MKEGVRDMDPEGNCKERKERLEKKRGMKMDDHPQFRMKEEMDRIEAIVNSWEDVIAWSDGRFF